MEAAKILSSRGLKDIHFILVGDGRKRQWVEEFINVNSTVHCVGRHPLESMSLFFMKADVLYFALKDSLIFNLTCPAKLQAYMSAGRPVLAMINGEVAEIVNDAKCGYTVPAGNAEKLADILVEFPFARVVSHKKSKYICWLAGLFYVKLIMS